MPKPVWLNSQLTQLVAAVIVAVIGSTVVQIKFTARANPFTSQMGDLLEKRVNNYCDKRAKEVSDSVMKEIDDENEKLKSNHRLWALREFLPKTTKIPPLSVENMLNRLEVQVDRLEERTHQIQRLQSACCSGTQARNKKPNGRSN